MSDAEISPTFKEKKFPQAPNQEQMLSAQPKIPLSKNVPKPKFSLSFLSKLHPSFFIAVITIILTIAAGIGAAILIGKLTQRGIKSSSGKLSAPTVTLVPTQNPLPTIVPSAEPSPSSSFENILEEMEPSTSSGGSEVTQSGTP